MCHLRIHPGNVTKSFLTTHQLESEVAIFLLLPLCLIIRRHPGSNEDNKSGSEVRVVDVATQRRRYRQ